MQGAYYYVLFRLVTILPYSYYIFPLLCINPVLHIASIRGSTPLPHLRTVGAYSHHRQDHKIWAYIIQSCITCYLFTSTSCGCDSVITWCGCHLCFVQTKDRRWSDKNSYNSNSIENVVLYLHWHVSSQPSATRATTEIIQRYQKCEIWDMDDVVQ